MLHVAYYDNVVFHMHINPLCWSRDVGLQEQGTMSWSTRSTNAC